MRSPLESLQRRFVRSATFAPDPEFVRSIAGGGRLSAAEAVDVYAKGYRARLTSALGETFEACWRVLGDEGFFAATKDYIARSPSLSHDLSDYGAGFADFLDARKDLAHAPFLGDLARFEWAFKEVFHRAPHEGLSAKALAAATGPASVLVFGAACERLALRHRVFDIWKRDRADDTPLEKTDWQGEQSLLLYKQGSNEVLVRELTTAENAALKALMDGLPLGEALSSVKGLGAAETKRLFAFLAESGLVTKGSGSA